MPTGGLVVAVVPPVLSLVGRCWNNEVFSVLVVQHSRGLRQGQPDPEARRADRLPSPQVVAGGRALDLFAGVRPVGALLHRAGVDSSKAYNAEHGIDPRTVSDILSIIRPERDASPVPADAGELGPAAVRRPVTWATCRRRARERFSCSQPTGAAAPEFVGCFDIEAEACAAGF